MTEGKARLSAACRPPARLHTRSTPSLPTYEAGADTSAAQGVRGVESPRAAPKQKPRLPARTSVPPGPSGSTHSGRSGGLGQPRIKRSLDPRGTSAEAGPSKAPRVRDSGRAVPLLLPPACPLCMCLPVCSAEGTTAELARSAYFRSAEKQHRPAERTRQSTTASVQCPFSDQGLVALFGHMPWLERNTGDSVRYNERAASESPTWLCQLTDVQQVVLCRWTKGCITFSRAVGCQPVGEQGVSIDAP